MREILASNDVRTLIANQLGVDIKHVTNEAHFTDDLGADWLDRLELMIVIEDQFADVVITDEDVDQIEVVGDCQCRFNSPHLCRSKIPQAA